MGIVHCTDKKYLINFRYLPLDTAYVLRDCSERDNAVHVETYRGKILTTRERNYHDDSDFYAVVWDNGALRSIEYASTRYYSYHDTATVDATEDVLAEANAFARKEMYEILQGENAWQSERVDKNRKVRVIRGRKCPVGTEGTVIYLTEPVSYNYGATHTRKALIALDDEMESLPCPKHWDKGNCYRCKDKGSIERYKNTAWVADADNNLEVTNSEEYLIPDSEIKNIAERCTWASLHGRNVRNSGLLYV